MNNNRKLIHTYIYRNIILSIPLDIRCHLLFKNYVWLVLCPYFSYFMTIQYKLYYNKCRNRVKATQKIETDTKKWYTQQLPPQTTKKNIKLVAMVFIEKHKIACKQWIMNKYSQRIEYTKLTEFQTMKRNCMDETWKKDTHHFHINNAFHSK